MILTCGHFCLAFSFTVEFLINNAFLQHMFKCSVDHVITIKKMHIMPLIVHFEVNDLLYLCLPSFVQ